MLEMNDSTANTHLVAALKQALQCLPGVGPKSAQRMAFHLLERDREGAKNIGKVLTQALANVGHCERCHNFSEKNLCSICASPRRDAKTLCIVETPADFEAIEKAGVYKGKYFVLMGHLSPLDDIGPEQLGIEKLIKLCDSESIDEVILATNLTIEGQATADLILGLLEKRPIIVTRLSRGVPIGGELEYLDPETLDQAFSDRRNAK